MGDPFVLLDVKGTRDIFRRCNRVLIGHNRWATSGSINRKNAHPFDLDEIVGVHNGTLTNKYALKDHQQYDVDSEALFDNIERFGLKETISQVRGAWALCWYNKVDQSLNFLRNSERPLFYAYSENKKTIVWASEAWMITNICRREDYKISEIFTFNEDHSYKWDLNLEKPDELGKPVCTEVKGLPPVQQFKQQQRQGLVIVSPNPQSVSQSHYETSLDQSYLGRKIALLIADVKRDECGCQYLLCEDPVDAGKDLRIYFHNKKVDHLVNSQATGIVSGAKRVVGSRRMFYKVDFKSVELMELEVKDDFEITTEDGFVIGKEELERYYTDCAWCSSPIDHKDKGNLYYKKDKTVLCSCCKADSSVMQYM